MNNIGELRLNDNMLEGEVPIGEETVRTLGRKLRIHNNPGLCWGLDINHDYGVGECKKEGVGWVDRTLQHVDGEETRTGEVVPPSSPGYKLWSSDRRSSSFGRLLVGFMASLAVLTV
ncbi:hypothetical protein MLD38_030154 [Melastoma candidum]|uniref:Uncharacterized protein n=1 Tax=Melastoma candidum TaxID=119954 RepID=A0ACB9MLE4_9MYRT|nr:hypothetical protein MLD38_030154 [Melastoma candidum]